VPDQGEDVLLDLPRAIAMTDGDGLQLEDGKWLKVRAAAELVVEVSHRDPNKLARLAWHLGNRHFPTEIRDQVIAFGPTMSSRRCSTASERIASFVIEKGGLEKSSS
jgi:urease accessory protein